MCNHPCITTIKQQKRNERKATVAQQVIAIQQVYLAEGWHIFHFDGSAKHYPKAGWVGGFGSCHQGHWEFSSPLDTLEKQTNNRAELKAAISAVVKVICAGWHGRQGLHMAATAMVPAHRPRAQLRPVGSPTARHGHGATHNTVGLVPITPRHTRQ